MSESGGNNQSGKRRKFDYTFKVITIGDKSVGKTCCTTRYFHSKFADQNISTMGVDQNSKIVNGIQGKSVKLICFDTAGQERFKTLTTAYYKGVQGVILMYDVTNIASF